MRDKTIGSWDRVLPVHVGTMKRRGGGVKSIAMQTEKATEEVLRYSPRHWEGGRDSERATDVKHLGEGIFYAGLKGDAEKHISSTNKDNSPPTTFPATLFMACWQRNVAMLFDTRSDGWDDGVKEQKA
ncbi:hypothetical protein MMC12_004467 [Toensbergia leucococca]|nr:hypothetical protein [Toensbergia leucococca]